MTDELIEKHNPATCESTLLQKSKWFSAYVLKDDGVTYYAYSEDQLKSIITLIDKRYEPVVDVLARIIKASDNGEVDWGAIGEGEAALKQLGDS